MPVSGLDAEKVMHKRLLRDFQPLKTKAFEFTSDKYKRQMSAQETYGGNTTSYIRNHQGSIATTGSLNSETKRIVGKDFAEYYNTSSAVGLKPLRPLHQGTSVMKVNEGSINIVT